MCLWWGQIGVIERQKNFKENKFFIQEVKDQWELINQEEEEKAEEKSGRAKRIPPDRVMRICFQKTEKEKLDLGFPVKILVYVNICISFSALGGT